MTTAEVPVQKMRPNTTRICIDVTKYENEKKLNKSAGGIDLPDTIDDTRALREFPVVSCGDLVRITKPGDVVIVSIATLLPYEQAGTNAVYAFLTEAEIIAVVPQ